MIHCLRIGKKTCLCTKAFKAMIKSEVDRLYLHQLAYEMDSADLPDDYIYF